MKGILAVQLISTFLIPLIQTPSVSPSPRSVLKANLANLGGFKTLPYLVMFLTSNLGGWVGDHLIIKKRFSVAAARKSVNTLGARA